MNEISPADLVRMCPAFLSDDPSSADFLMAKMEQGKEIPIFQYPCRFHGFLLICCREGDLTVRLNLKEFQLRKNAVLFCEPGNLIQLSTEEGVSGYVCVLSENMIQEIAPDHQRYFQGTYSLHQVPVLTVPEEGFQTILGYWELLERVMHTEALYRRESIRALVNSQVYFLRSFWYQDLAGEEPQTEGRSPRAIATVDAFIRLVTEYHMTEHYLAFYAERLGITPKYLSKLVREVTGRSAPEWVDAFLVLEAKNLLKYSNLAIKEIVYRLHFPDQSSFYKFFKLHTGMIPSEYRKS